MDNIILKNEKDKKNFTVSDADNHPNKKGHEKIAEVIYENL